jgi:glycosyltransferase involved in cell wall biosynthesis
VPTNKKVPPVTVVVHTFNHENYISDCLDGIVSQDAFADINILIIDDASTDSTIVICQLFQSRFQEKIEVVRLPVNQLSQGLFVGLHNLKAIQSKYVAWCDGDDYWIDKSKVSNQMKILESRPEIGIIHTDYLFSKKGIKGFENRERTNYDIEKSRKFNRGSDLIRGNHIKHSTTMIVRDAIDFDFVGASRGIYAGDWLICVSAARHRDIYFMTEKTTVARITENGIWNGSSSDRNMSQKEKVRWHCAAYLPESELRELFRQRVVTDWIRNLISKSTFYKIVRPFVLMARYAKVQVKKC